MKHLHKMVTGLILAGICTLLSANAFADTVAVMKLDIEGENIDGQAASLQDAIRAEIDKQSDLTLDAQGGDLTYTEMQIVTGCSLDDSTPIACYDTVRETLRVSAIIFGSVKTGGEAHLIWYSSNGGSREITGTVTDIASAEKLAQSLIVGDMGSLIVTSNVPGADVFVNGKRMGMSAEYENTATPIPLVTGNYQVAVRKDGFTREDAVATIIEKGKTARVHVEMFVAKDPEEARRAVLISGYTAAGVGAAALIAGAIFAGIGYKFHGEMDKAIKEERDGTKATEKHDKEWLYTAANVAFPVGGFFVAAAVALIVTGFVYDFSGENIDRKLADTSYMPNVDVQLTPEYQGMTLGWTF